MKEEKMIYQAFPEYGCFYALDGATLMAVAMNLDGSMDTADGESNVCEVTDIDPAVEWQVRAVLSA